jgi:hypothetical protein
MTRAADATPGDAPPDDVQALNDQIERTRTELGETVEALAAKADVKARAQDKAGEIASRLTNAASQMREQTAARADQVAATVWDTTPEPVRQAARRAAGTARERRVPLAVALGTVLLVGWLIARRRR